MRGKCDTSTPEQNEHKVYAFFIYLTEGTVSAAPASITSVEWTTAGCGVDGWKCQSADECRKCNWTNEWSIH